MALLNHPLALFAVLLLFLFAVVELGFRLALRRSVNADAQHHEQIVAARDGIGVLLSLLLGFTLAMGLPRFDERKQLVVDEANSIGTTALRAEALPEPARTKMLALLRQYVDARMEFSRDGVSPDQVQAGLLRSGEIQKELWGVAIGAARENPTSNTSLLLESLNETFDENEKRVAARENRVPPAVWFMLVLMSALTCLTVGYSMPRRFWYVMLLTPLMIAIVLTLVADLDSPRSGWIRVTQPSMERLRQSLYEDAGHLR
jgi:hypothetical protein